MLNHLIVGITAYIASITDYKTHKVPNYLSVGLIIIALILNYNNPVTTFLVMLITFSFLFLFQLSKAWGGGDTKLITGMMGVYSTYKINADFYFLYIFLLSLIIFIFLYLATIALIRFVKKKTLRVKVPLVPAIYLSWLFCLLLDYEVFI